MNDEQLSRLMDKVAADHAAKGQTYGDGVPTCRAQAWLR